MTALAHQQAKRLHGAMRALAGAEAADALLSALPLSSSPSDAKKAAWARASCEALCGALGEDAARDARRACHCRPSPPNVRDMRAAWEARASLSDFARRATERAAGAFAIKADGEALILIYPRCCCSFVARADGPLPALWCECSLGYAEDFFGQITGLTARASLLESVRQGGAACRIRVALSADTAQKSDKICSTIRRLAP